LLKGIATSWTAAVLTIVFTYVLTPYTQRCLGQDNYGVWLLITSFTGYLSLLALGIPMTSVRHLAVRAGQDRAAELNSGITLFLGVNAALAALVMLTGAIALPLFQKLYPLPEPVQQQANLAFVLVLVQIGSAFLSILPSSVLQAHEKYVHAHSITILALLTRAVVNLVGLYLTSSILVMALTQLAGTLCEFLAGWIMVRRQVPWSRFRLGWPVWSEVRPVLSFSVYVLVLSLGIQLSFQTDALIIGRVLGVSSVPYYSVPNSLMVSVMGLILSIAAVVMPTATRLQTKGEHEQIRILLLKWTKVAFILILTVTLYLVVFGPAFLGRWMGPDYEQQSGGVLQILMLASLIFLPVRGVALPLLMGLGRPRTVTLSFLACAVANVILSLILIRPLGLVGEALGTALPNIAFAGIAVTLACRAAGLPLGSLFAYVAPGPLLASLPALAFLYVLQRNFAIDTYFELFLTGGVMCLIQGAALLVALRRDAHINLPPVPGLRRFV